MPPTPRPETPQTSARLAADMMLLTGENGVCTSQRTPALSVSVGVTRHESCTKPSSCPACPPGVACRDTRTVFVAASRAACAGHRATRPVSSAYSARASPSWPPDAPGKVGRAEQPEAGSLAVSKREIDARAPAAASRPRSGPGTTPPPKVTLCCPSASSACRRTCTDRRCVPRACSRVPVGQADIGVEVDRVAVPVSERLRPRAVRLAEEKALACGDADAELVDERRASSVDRSAIERVGRRTTVCR